MSKFLLTLLIIGLVSPYFISANGVGQPPKMPETWDEILAIGKKILIFFPQTLKTVWQEAVAIWQKMAGWFINLWNSYLWPKIEWFWQKITAFFSEETEKRKEMVQEELEKEKQEAKQELKEETAKAGKSLWQKLKDIIPGI